MKIAKGLRALGTVPTTFNIDKSVKDLFGLVLLVDFLTQRVCLIRLLGLGTDNFRSGAEPDE